MLKLSQENIKKELAMKKLLWILLMCLIVSGCTQKQEPIKQMAEPLDIVVVNDFHFLGDEVNDKSEYFYKAMLQADGRMTEYIVELTEEWVRQMLVEMPDVIVINGDFSYNGEVASHIQFEKTIRPLKDAGILVLMNIGNHDMYLETTFAYRNNDAVPIDSATYEDYFPLFKDYGYNDAVLPESGNCAAFYSVKANDDILLMILEGGYQMFYPEVLEWAQKQIDYAKENDMKIITFTHENLLLHNERFDLGYRIVGSQDFIDLFNGEQLINISAHIHIQDIKQENNVTEITNSAFLKSPHSYGQIHIDENFNFTYKTKDLDTTNLNSLVEGNDFAAYSKDYFKMVNGFKFANRTDVIEDEELRAQALEFMLETNYLYYQGMLTSEYQKENQELIDKMVDAGVSMNNYLNTMLENDGINDATFETKMK